MTSRREVFQKLMLLGFTTSSELTKESKVLVVAVNGFAEAFNAWALVLSESFPAIVDPEQVKAWERVREKWVEAAVCIKKFNTGEG